MASLIDELRSAAAAIPASHVPSAAEIPGILAGLVALEDHGREFLTAAEDGVDAVAELFGKEQPAPDPVAPSEPASVDPVAPAPTPAYSPDTGPNVGPGVGPNVVSGD